MSHICLENPNVYFLENLRLVKIIFLMKVMAVLVDKGQVVHDVNVAALNEVFNCLGFVEGSINTYLRDLKEAHVFFFY
jgi:hypothetical protein